MKVNREKRGLPLPYKFKDGNSITLYVDGKMTCRYIDGLLGLGEEREVGYFGRITLKHVYVI